MDSAISLSGRCTVPIACGSFEDSRPSQPCGARILRDPVAPESDHGKQRFFTYSTVSVAQLRSLRSRQRRCPPFDVYSWHHASDSWHSFTRGAQAARACLQTRNVDGRNQLKEREFVCAG